MQLCLMLIVCVGINQFNYILVLAMDIITKQIFLNYRNLDINLKCINLSLMCDNSKEKLSESKWEKNFERNQTRIGTHPYLGDTEECDYINISLLYM